jgi:hypothetical protein
MTRSNLSSDWELLHTQSVRSADWDSMWVLDRSYPTANRSHVCDVCGGTISPGEGYRRVVYKVVGAGLYMEKTHNTANACGDYFERKHEEETRRDENPVSVPHEPHELDSLISLCYSSVRNVPTRKGL